MMPRMMRPRLSMLGVQKVIAWDCRRSRTERKVAMADVRRTLLSSSISARGQEWEGVIDLPPQPASHFDTETFEHVEAP